MTNGKAKLALAHCLSADLRVKREDLEDIG